MYPPQRAGMRTTTVHDLGPIHFPEWVDSRTRRLHVPKARHAAETCDVLFANSRYTADDVVRTLGVSEERVVVAYPGIHERFLAEGPRTERPAPYLLTTATSEPRKNLQNLLAAFALVRARRPELELLVVGEEHTEPPDGVEFLGYVAAEDLPPLYRGAEAFVFPSLFEGFGIPVVEAMAIGHADRRLDAPLARRGERRCGGPRRAGEPGGDRIRHRDGADGRTSARASRPRTCAEVHLARLRRGHASRV